jgi:hypothetical protein
MSSKVLDKHSHRWGGSKALANTNSCSNLSDGTVILKHNIIAPSNGTALFAEALLGIGSSSVTGAP